MRLLTTTILGGLLALPAMAQDITTPAPPPAASTAPEALPEVTGLSLEEVISRQLAAFNARDVDLAWRFASPMIQGLFGNPRNFGVMVSQGYPMVWDNSAARFVASREEAGRIYQQVMMQDTNGALHMLEYAMILTPQGWKIDGVSLLPAPDVGV